MVADLFGHHQRGGTARAAALSGSDHSVRSLATRSVQNREGPTWTPEVPEQSGQPRVERLQSRDPISDLRTSYFDHAGQLGSRVRAVPGMAPARDPGRVLERDVEPAQVDDQTPRVTRIVASSRCEVR
jgi:hypothetical protein